MAVVAPTSIKPAYDQITVTGATGVGTKVFDGSAVTGDIAYWHVFIQNLDADAGDTAVVGFDAAVDTGTGWVLGVASDTSEASRINFVLPPHTSVYVNCTNAETRDIRVLAIPVVC